MAALLTPPAPFDAAAAAAAAAGLAGTAGFGAATPPPAGVLLVVP